MVDLHAGQIQGFFDIPTDNLFASPVFVDDIKKRFENNKTIIVSPDVGGVVKQGQLQKGLNVILQLSIKEEKRQVYPRL